MSEVFVTLGSEILSNNTYLNLTGKISNIFENLNSEMTDSLCDTNILRTSAISNISNDRYLNEANKTSSDVIKIYRLVNSLKNILELEIILLNL